jgi:hypothetical protein
LRCPAPAILRRNPSSQDDRRRVAAHPLVARVEVNYRPQAYQAKTSTGSPLTVVDSTLRRLGSSPSGERTKYPDSTLSRVGKRMRHKRVIPWLAQPELKDGTSTHRYVYRLNTSEWVGL